MAERRESETTVRGDTTRVGGLPNAGDGTTGHVDARRAAVMLGLSQRAVRNLIASGQLDVEREGEGAAARLLVSLDSVERLRSERGARGESPKE